MYSTAEERGLSEGKILESCVDERSDVGRSCGNRGVAGNRQPLNSDAQSRTESFPPSRRGLQLGKKQPNQQFVDGIRALPQNITIHQIHSIMRASFAAALLLALSQVHGFAPTAGMARASTLLNAEIRGPTEKSETLR